VLDGLAQLRPLQRQCRRADFFDHTPRRALGFSNVFVPGEGRLYVAPSLILHYIAEHGYAPPQEFQAAVLACPPMGSAEYLAAVAEFGVLLDG